MHPHPLEAGWQQVALSAGAQQDVWICGVQQEETMAVFSCCSRFGWFCSGCSISLPGIWIFIIGFFPFIITPGLDPVSYYERRQIEEKDASTSLEAPLEDLARQENLPTATLTAKRLEYRAPVQLTGSGWPLLLRPLFIGLIGLGLALWIGRWIAVYRQRRRKS